MNDATLKTTTRNVIANALVLIVGYQRHRDVLAFVLEHEYAGTVAALADQPSQFEALKRYLRLLTDGADMANLSDADIDWWKTGAEADDDDDDDDDDDRYADACEQDDDADDAIEDGRASSWPRAFASLPQGDCGCDDSHCDTCYPGGRDLIDLTKRVDDARAKGDEARRLSRLRTACREAIEPIVAAFAAGDIEADEAGEQVAAALYPVRPPSLHGKRIDNGDGFADDLPSDLPEHWRQGLTQGVDKGDRVPAAPQLQPIPCRRQADDDFELSVYRESCVWNGQSYEWPDDCVDLYRAQMDDRDFDTIDAAKRYARKLGREQRANWRSCLRFYVVEAIAVGGPRDGHSAVTVYVEDSDDAVPPRTTKRHGHYVAPSHAMTDRR